MPLYEDDRRRPVPGPDRIGEQQRDLRVAPRALGLGRIGEPCRDVERSTADIRRRRDRDRRAAARQARVRARDRALEDVEQAVGPARREDGRWIALAHCAHLTRAVRPAGRASTSPVSRKRAAAAQPVRGLGPRLSAHRNRSKASARAPRGASRGQRASEPRGQRWSARRSMFRARPWRRLAQARSARSPAVCRRVSGSRRRGSASLAPSSERSRRSAARLREDGACGPFRPGCSSAPRSLC